MESVFLSYTKEEPYVKADRILSNAEIDGTLSAESVFKDEYLYLVITDGQYNRIDIRVENESGTGASLYISPVDIMDVPLHWGKLIQLFNIDARAEVYTYKFCKRWAVLNNIYIVKQSQITGTLNIYEV